MIQFDQSKLAEPQRRRLHALMAAQELFPHTPSSFRIQVAQWIETGIWPAGSTTSGSKSRT